MPSGVQSGRGTSVVRPCTAVANVAALAHAAARTYDMIEFIAQFWALGRADR